MAGAGPLGQEAAFEISVYQSFLHLIVHRGIHHVQEGEEAAEGVPEARVGEHISWSHLAIVGAIVHGVSVSVNLVEAAWEQHRAVEARIEGAQVVNVGVVHLDAAQRFVPGFSALFCHLVKRAVAHLFQVQHSLFGADKRRCYAHQHLFATFGVEAHDGAHMVFFGFELALFNVAIGNGGAIGEGLAKLHHKIVFKVTGHATAVLGGVANNHIFLGQHLYVRATVEGVDHDVCLIGFGKGEAHDGGAAGGCHLGHHVIVGQIYAIVVGFGYLGFV